VFGNLQQYLKYALNKQRLLLHLNILQLGSFQCRTGGLGEEAVWPLMRLGSCLELRALWTPALNEFAGRRTLCVLALYLKLRQRLQRWTPSAGFLFKFQFMWQLSMI